MKAADGVQIAERYRDRHTLLKCWTEAGKHPKTEYNTFEFAQEIVRLIEELSRAEERGRVLREALEKIPQEIHIFQDIFSWQPGESRNALVCQIRDTVQGIVDAALTAAPEQGKEAKS